MQRKSWMFVVVGSAAAVVASGWFLFSGQLRQSVSNEVAITAEKIVTGKEQLAAQARARGLSEQDLQDILDNPRVAKYLQREENKKFLKQYFTQDSSAENAEQTWQLIESIESEGGILAYEALALKLAWLERNSETKQEFEESSRGLAESYRQRAELSAQEYDPYEDVAGFADYKAEEGRIVAEVMAMESFPNGLTRQQYLRERLQEAREKAYGN